MEGFYTTEEVPNRPQRNNNPLDLIYCPETISFGATGGDPRFAVFTDLETGWVAAQRWLSIPARFDVAGRLIGGYAGATFEQVINRFAPPSENNTEEYIQFVCSRTNYQPTDIMLKEMLVIPE